jgi:hypothetical protein
MPDILRHLHIPQPRSLMQSNSPNTALEHTSFFFTAAFIAPGVDLHKSPFGEDQGAWEGLS